MKFRKKYLYLLIAVFVCSLIAAFFYLENLEEPDKKGLLFLTVGIDQKSLTYESSSYEIQRAAEHFSDLILGWTYDPSFEKELKESLHYDVRVTGQRQEKQNLIFYLYARPEVYNDSAGELLLDLIESRINEYNRASNSGYVIALSRYSMLENSGSNFRIGAGVVFLSLIFTGILLFGFEYAFGNRFKTTS